MKKFFLVQDTDEAEHIVATKSVSHVERWEDGIKIDFADRPPITTRTFDLDGFAMNVLEDDKIWNALINQDD